MKSFYFVKTKTYVFQFTEKELDNMMPNLCKKAEVKSFGFHAIRHHVASLINDSGKAGTKAVQEFLRHRRQSTTDRYLHTMSRVIKQAVEILDEKIVTHCNADEHEKEEKKEG